MAQLSLRQPAWARFDLTWIPRISPPPQAMTTVSLLWECTFGVVLLRMLTRHRRWGTWPVRGAYLGGGSPFTAPCGRP